MEALGLRLEPPVGAEVDRLPVIDLVDDGLYRRMNGSGSNRLSVGEYEVVFRE